MSINKTVGSEKSW